MKLSEAIVEGCKLSPHKNIRTLFENKGDGYNHLKSCAMGAAIIGKAGMDKASKLHNLDPDIQDYFPLIDFNGNVLNPTTNKIDTLYWVIVDLNDNKGWTREQIAEWLKGIGK